MSDVFQLKGVVLGRTNVYRFEGEGGNRVTLFDAPPFARRPQDFVFGKDAIHVNDDKVKNKARYDELIGQIAEPIDQFQQVIENELVEAARKLKSPLCRTIQYPLNECFGVGLIPSRIVLCQDGERPPLSGWDGGELWPNVVTAVDLGGEGQFDSAMFFVEGIGEGVLVELYAKDLVSSSNSRGACVRKSQLSLDGARQGPIDTFNKIKKLSSKTIRLSWKHQPLTMFTPGEHVDLDFRKAGRVIHEVLVNSGGDPYRIRVEVPKGIQVSAKTGHGKEIEMRWHEAGYWVGEHLNVRRRDKYRIDVTFDPVGERVTPQVKARISMLAVVGDYGIYE